MRYPIATVIGVGLTMAAGSALSTVPAIWLSNQAKCFLGLTIGTGLFLFLSAFMAMNPSRLDHLGALIRSALFVSLGLALLLGLSLFLMVRLIPESTLSNLDWVLVAGTSYYGAMGLGAVLLSCTVVAVLVAWPLTASTGLPLSKSIPFVSRYVENGLYYRLWLTVTIAAVGVALTFVPFLGVLAPTLLAQLSATIFERFINVDTRFAGDSAPPARHS